MRRWVCLLLCFSLSLALCCACASSGGGGTPSDGEEPGESANPSVSNGRGDDPVNSDSDSPASWSNFDLDTAWFGSDTVLKCENGDVTVENGTGASFASGRLSITQGGTYVLSGSLDGQVFVQVADTEKVHLVFNGFSLTCADNSPLYCEDADKVSITLADGTENSVTDNGSGFVQGTDPGNGRYAGAIHSKCSLTINGNGSLSVVTTYRHGVVCNKNLRIVSGEISVQAAEDGLKGKNSLSARGGTVRVAADGDGLKVSEEEDPEKGYLVLEGGDYTVECDGDGLDVSRLIQVTGGTLRVKSGDHALRSLGDVKIGGNAVLELDAYSGSEDSDAKGIKAEGDVKVSGGSLRVTRSFEGIESREGFVKITGGQVELTSSDDAISAETLIEVSGGSLFADARGDGLDSNGDIVFSGGTVVVQGPTNNANGTLDCGDDGGVIRTDGGVLLAYGSAGQAKFPDAGSSAQCYVRIDAELTEGTVYSLRGADGSAVCTFVLRQDAQSVCISVPALQSGAKYTLYESVTPTGDDAHGLYADPASSGGSAFKTFTAS